MAQKQSSSPYLSWILVLYLLCIVVVMIWFGFKSSPATKIFTQTADAPTPTRTPTPTPIKLPPGKGIYAVSQGKHDGPTISQVSFDPLDVRNGQTLTITLQVANTTPVQTILGTLTMDNTKKQLEFARVSITGKNELWKTTVLINDTLWYQYTLKITAQAANGISHLIITPR